MTITSGTRTLMIALTRLEQSSVAGRMPDVQTGQVFWASSRDAPGLVAGNLASYAPDNTTPPQAEPPHTAHGSAGFGKGASNSSP